MNRETGTVGVSTVGPMRQLGTCDVACDMDCDAACHWSHYPRWKRQHQPEDCPSTREHPGQSHAPYWTDGRVTIFQGDACAVLDDLATSAERFDLGFADPPYNYGVAYDGYSDDLPADEYEASTREWYRRLCDISTATIVTPGHGNLPLWFGIRKPSGIGCWYKPGGTGSSHLGWCEWEPWLYWGPRLGGADTIKATLNPTFKSDVGHPCPKPVELLKGLLVKTKASSVVDPFMGSGTTLVAAKALGLRAVGIEQSERYCELAATRLAQGVLDLEPLSWGDAS